MRFALLLFVIVVDLGVIGICLWVIRENRRTVRWLHGEGLEPRSAKTLGKGYSAHGRGNS